MRISDWSSDVCSSDLLTDDHMLYATISRGFRSGTPNLYSVLDSGPPIVKPDYVWNEEVGAKLSWFNGHLITNVSAYRIDWQDVQATVVGTARSEEHTSELQSLLRSSYAVFCLNTKTQHSALIAQNIIYTKQT